MNFYHGYPVHGPDDAAARAAAAPASASASSPAEAPQPGWTTARKLRFLEHLAQRGHVRAACAAVELSAEAAYKLRRREAAFAASWDAALILARRVAEEELAVRALDGIEEQVWYRGELVGLRRRHDTRLLLAHLGRLDRHAEIAPESEARAERFDELLAQVAGLGFPGGEADRWDPQLPPTRDDYAQEAADAVRDDARWDTMAALLDAAAEAGRIDADWEGDARPELWLTGEEANLVDDAEIAASGAARAAAAAVWDDWRARAFALVDAGGEGEGEGESEEAGQGEADDAPPMEFKSLDPVNRVNHGETRAARAGALHARGADASSSGGRPGERPGAPARDGGGSPVNTKRSVNTNRLLAALALTAAITLPLSAQAAVVKLGATLNGANEPGGGDADGTGTFVAEVDADAGDFCFTVTSAKIGAPTMAHVHTGATGVNGAPVITIDPKGNDECVAVEPDVLKPIVATPEAYYVNIHNAEFPGGAIRGQLAVKK